MGTLANFYLKKETLEEMLKVLNAKREKGISVDISISDTTDNYGNNVSTYVSQNKEDRAAKKKKFYIGNGKVFWTDGKVSIPEKSAKKETEQEPILNESEASELPF